jgi:lambda family phage minor tail protein L
MSENIALQLAQLRHDAEINMFVIDAQQIAGITLYLAAYTTETRQALVWQGQTYAPFPIEGEGWEVSGQGSLPRPRLRVANVLGQLGVLVRQYRGLRGAKVIRKRTLKKYLDAVNFQEGNPRADPTAEFPDELWLIDKVNKRDPLVIEWELGSPMDVEGTMLPRGQVLADVCLVPYRSPECGYTGPAVSTADGTPTTDMALDDCGNCLRGCRLRPWPGSVLNHGGFPGVGSFREV